MPGQEPHVLDAESGGGGNLFVLADGWHLVAVVVVEPALFPAEHAPTAFAHVAVVDGTVVGMAIWYITFSTWLGGAGIWLEDLFVSPQHRGSGLGKGLLATLAAVCTERGYRRLEWWVLRWNTPSIGFYDSIGGQPMDEWLTYRLHGEALAELTRAATKPSAP